MRRALYVIGFIFGVVLIWSCGFLTGRITAPEKPPRVVYVRQKAPAAKKAKQPKPERQIFTSKRGKQYYITSAGNRVYLKRKTEVEQ